MDLLWSMVLKLSGNTMGVNIMGVHASKIQPTSNWKTNKSGLNEKPTWRLMVARLLKCHVVYGEKNWDIFEEIHQRLNMDVFYVLIIRIVLYFEQNGQVFILSIFNREMNNCPFCPFSNEMLNCKRILYCKESRMTKFLASSVVTSLHRMLWSTNTWRMDFCSHQL